MNEQEVQRRLTAAFIAADPDIIVFTPRTLERTSSGGQAWVIGTPREPLAVKLTSVADVPQFLRSTDGQQSNVAYVIIAEYGAPIADGDVFTHEGQEYVVQDVLPSNGYEVRALAESRGN